MILENKRTKVLTKKIVYLLKFWVVFQNFGLFDRALVCLCHTVLYKCGHTKQTNKERRKGKTSIFVLGVKALNLHCQKVATQNLC